MSHFHHCDDDFDDDDDNDSDDDGEQDERAEVEQNHPDHLRNKFEP